MCQLLGMNCAQPTDFSFSFRGFTQRGGKTDIHSHGWGLALYEGRGLRTFLGTKPACESPLVDLVRQYPIKTYNMMAHIRYATQGNLALENVHPFQRELWGIQWCFAHNGDVPSFSGNPENFPVLKLGKATKEKASYFPVGDTDSEAVFCAILNALKAEFSELPTLPVLYETLQRLCCQIVQGQETSILNFLLGCGPYTLFAYSWPGARPGSCVWNGLWYTVREPPFSSARLVDVDYSIDFSKLTTSSDQVAVIATKPLTADEEWTEVERGQLLMFDYGRAYTKACDCEIVEMEGRGLSSKVFRKDGTSTTEQLVIPQQKFPRVM